MQRLTALWDRLAWRSARALDRPSGLAIGDFDGYEVAYRRGTADEAVIDDSFGRDIFFPAVPGYRPGDDDVIVDVGAHIGTFSLLAAAKVRGGHVHAVEASEDSYNLLRINVALNHCTNVRTYHLALAGRDGTTTLFHDAGNWGHTTVKRVSESTEEVESCTLAAFMERNRIETCHLIKLNCEGGEFPILLSTPSDVLQRFGTMLVLYHNDLWSENTPRDLTAHLEASGFACVVRNRSRKRGWIIATNQVRDGAA